MVLNTTNVTNVALLAQYVSENTGDLFGVGILFTMVAIIFISSINWGTDRALAIATYSGLIISLLLRRLALLNARYVYMFLILVAVATVWLYKNSTYE